MSRLNHKSVSIVIIIRTLEYENVKLGKGKKWRANEKSDSAKRLEANTNSHVGFYNITVYPMLF